MKETALQEVLLECLRRSAEAREIMMDSLFTQLEFRETETGKESEGELGREKERERSVSESPCEESVISQAKCEWLTRLRKGARLCSRRHQVKATEGWDLQRRVVHSKDFDQTQSQERSLTDC
ncbi:uncharacterized protein V6R79_022395 [Siganus canaliculatus]